MNQDPESYAALSALEAGLTRLLREVTGYEVAVTDDLFDQGVNSIDVAQYFAAIEASFGVAVPLKTATSHPTVRDLAIWLAEPLRDDTLHRSTIRLTVSRAARQLFCVHGIGGHVLVYMPLGRALDGRVELHAFEAASRTNSDTVDATIEHMAARYVSDMRRIQPNGPYLIAGYSMGGVISIEMARLLHDQGEQVERVFLLDCPADAAALGDVEDRVVEFLSLSLNVSEPTVSAERRDFERGIEEIHRRLHGRVPLNMIRQFGMTYLNNAQAFRAHQTVKYNGEVTLFYTNPTEASSIWAISDNKEPFERSGWGKTLDSRKTRVQEVPGDHWSVLSTYTTELSSHIVNSINHPVVTSDDNVSTIGIRASFGGGF